MRMRPRRAGAEAPGPPGGAGRGLLQSPLAMLPARRPRGGVAPAAMPIGPSTSYTSTVRSLPFRVAGPRLRKSKWALVAL